uniref:Uncharacterized protein n=1 Tax=Rhipicephalus zambeziensis TaxID=60191 RepID=A0A224YFX1_9ACAR
MIKNRWPEFSLNVALRLASAPVLSDSGAARVFIKNILCKLSSRPNAPKFRQLVCEHSRITPHNTDCERKVGVMAPLKMRKPLTNLREIPEATAQVEVTWRVWCVNSKQSKIHWRTYTQIFVLR